MHLPSTDNFVDRNTKRVCGKSCGKGMKEVVVTNEENEKQVGVHILVQLCRWRTLLMGEGILKKLWGFFLFVPKIN